MTFGSKILVSNLICIKFLHVRIDGVDCGLL
jgi:hypothetical protein